MSKEEIVSIKFKVPKSLKVKVETAYLHSGESSKELFYQKAIEKYSDQIIKSKKGN